QPIKLMSKLTDSLMSSIDYEKVKASRRNNYKFFEKHLKRHNLLKLKYRGGAPMVYPFRTRNKNLRQKLINQKVFVATYWPNVISPSNKVTLEFQLAEQIIPLPVDQRYNKEDLEKIRRIINE